MGFNFDLSKAKELADKAVEGATQAFEEGKAFTEEKIIPGTLDLVDQAQKGVVDAKEKVFNAMDVNGDGQVGIDDIIILALQVPGVKINREEFLRKEFFKNHSQEQIDMIIQSTPSKAGITLDEVDHIANEVIQFERTCVSGISAALSAPGGMAMAATIPADISQYYGYMLRCAQKLMYLYGFPQIEIDQNKDNVIDTEIMNTLIICLGVMYGVAGASNALQKMAKCLAIGVEKQLMRKALTKGTIYPIVKSVAKWFNVKMTKQVFAGFFKKSIPIIGGVIGGGMTYLSFKPCCDTLKDSLRNTALCNPNFDAKDCIVDLDEPIEITQEC